MNGWIGRAGVVGAAVSALGLSMPISAAHATSLPSAVHIYAANSTNAGQAGYLVNAPASASVVDHFTVPRVTCNANVETAMGLGSIIFISSGAPDAANVIPYCPGGGSSAPIYYGGFLVAGSLTFTSFSPAPGDAIVTTASQTATSTKLTVRDITKKKSQSTTSAGGANADAFWGVETYTSSGITLPVPTFTKVSFTQGSLNGSTVRATGAVAEDLAEMTKIDVHTGTLNATGNGWKEIWKANS